MCLDVQMEKESISNKPRRPNYKNREVQYLYKKTGFSWLLRNKIKKVQIKIKGVV